MASITLKCAKKVRVKVGVSEMHDGFVCNISNSLFVEHGEFTDIISKPEIGDLSKNFKEFKTLP